MDKSRTLVGYVLALFSLLVIVSCGGGVTNPPEQVVEGLYSLQKISGQNLPWTFSQSAEMKLEVVSGDLLLNRDGTYTSTSLWRRSFGDGSPIRDEPGREDGTWVREGETIIIFNPGPLQRRGTIGLNSVSRDVPMASGGVWLFSK